MSDRGYSLSRSGAAEVESVKGTGMFRENRFIKKERTTRSLLFLVLGLRVLSSVVVCAQDLTTTDNKGPQIVSSPASIQVLKSSLEKGGGEVAWARVHSMQIRADVSMNGMDRTHSALLLDDWSGKDTKYRRRFDGRDTAPIDHNGAKNFAVRKKGVVKQVTEFDQARVLLSHAPFASAEILLRRPEYKIVPPRYRKCPPASLCFDVYRTIYKSGATMREQEWTISAATQMPTTIRYILPNSGTGLMQWKELEFGSFISTSGLMLPSEVDAKLPAGIKQHWHYSSPTPNVKFDTKSFDAEALK